MKKAWIVAEKEYKSYFNSSVAYFLAALFVFLMSFMFDQTLQVFAINIQRNMMMGGGNGLSLNDYVFGPHFGNINIILLIMVPALTMRLFAEEKKNRTLDLLMTSPLSALEIVSGKILAGCLVVWTILGFMAVYPVLLSFYASFDVGPILSGFVGMALLSAVYVAIGVFASSLTESAIIAYFLAFVIGLFFWVISWAGTASDDPTTQAIFNYLSTVSHFGTFIKGVIDTSAIVYYLSLIFMFGFFTERVVESARWR